MKTISYDNLVALNACSGQLQHFHDLFGEGPVAVTKELVGSSGTLD